jgi:RNA polymerase sigma-70 factor, ECF subfamily
VSSIAALPALAPPRLLARVAQGERGAMDDLFSAYGRLAYGIALRVLRDPGLAEDAVQDAFVSIWKSAASYRAGLASESAWIVMLVHRRAVDIVRRSERRPTELALYDEHAADDLAFADPYEAARVRAALAQLSEAERECLELAYYGGFTQTEIAGRIGVPVGTVKTRTMRGLGRLRDLLGES